MNTRRLIFLACFAVVVFSTSLSLAGSRAHSGASRATSRSTSHVTPTTRQAAAAFQHRNVSSNQAGRHFSRGTAKFQQRPSLNRGSRSFSRGTANFRRGTANFRHWNGNWRRHRHHSRVIFISSFGFPWYYSYPFYGSYYPYGYYPYGYGYDRYGYGYDSYGYGYGPYGSYDNGYQGGGTYDDEPGYSDDSGYYGGPRYGRDAIQNSSTVAQVQRTLAREGYYKGDIDGIMGPRTYYAIRTYQRAHNLRVDGAINEQLLGNMGLR